jgi:Asp-tRNA(Asn)/Glu-tRNA(Gln) amidotransferase A subunit family amidase
MSFDDEVGRLEAVTLAGKIRSGELSPVGVTEATLRRMEAAAGRFVGVTLRCRRLRDVHGGSAVWFARSDSPSSTEA